MMPVKKDKYMIINLINYNKFEKVTLNTPSKF